MPTHAIKGLPTQYRDVRPVCGSEHGRPTVGRDRTPPARPAVARAEPGRPAILAVSPPGLNIPPIGIALAIGREPTVRPRRDSHGPVPRPPKPDRPLALLGPAFGWAYEPAGQVVPHGFGPIVPIRDEGVLVSNNLDEVRAMARVRFNAVRPPATTARAERQPRDWPSTDLIPAAAADLRAGLSVTGTRGADRAPPTARAAAHAREPAAADTPRRGRHLTRV